MAISSHIMRSILNSIAARLDEARDISRYMTGLLVFLGLLGTFWGLIETVGSVGGVIGKLNVGGDAGSVFDSLKEGLAAPLAGMGISFSSSLFGLAGSLVLGFLDLQMSQAQNRFYTQLEDWLSTTVRDLGAEADGRAAPGAAPASAEIKVAIDRLKDAIAETGSGKAATAAMANLAEAIQGLVKHMRTEQQLIRDWVDSQAEQQREIQRLLERIGARRRPVAKGDPWLFARSRRESGMNYWPGFVDALSTLLLAIIFLLSVFVDRAVLPVAGSDRQGHRAHPPQRADRAAHRAAVDGEDRKGEPGGDDRAAAREPWRRRERARPPEGPVRGPRAAAPARPRARSTRSAASSRPRSA